MIFNIDDIVVYFPYEYVYPEQFAYMKSLKTALDAGGPSVLEMPSGTGKTVTLLSFILSYRLIRKNAGKLIYCSRTVSEIEKCLEEAQVVVDYIAKFHPQAKNMLILGLTSRRNLCVHERVSQGRWGRVVDAGCHALTAEFVRADTDAEKCSFFEQFEIEGGEFLPGGVFTLEELKERGRARGWCPYFMARQLLPNADVVVYSYQYVIDPKVSKVISSELKKNSILVFDEAHNIDNVCIDALSVTIDRRTIEASVRNLEKLTGALDRAKQQNAQRLRDEYNRLVQGLLAADDGNESNSSVSRARARALRAAAPTLDDDEVREAMPGNIRKAHHFLGAMRRLVGHVKSKMQTNVAVIETPLAFLQSVQQAIALDTKAMKFCSSRLHSLLQTLRITDTDQYTPVAVIADFAALVATYAQGFLIIVEPYDDRTPTIPDPVLQFACLDASIAMRPVLERFGSVIITSGTISPLEMYPRILNFTPVVTERFQMSLTRACICPMIVTRGSDQVAISSRYEERGDAAVVRNYGALLVDMCSVVPDGIVCFFPSYFYLEMIVGAWNEMGVLRSVLKQKLVFVETSDFTESALALQNYRLACDNGRGAVLLAVARGKVSEGIDFDHHYGRCVILFGIPYVYTESRILRARLEFLRDQYQIREGEFLTFDAMRTASQCIGRVIRGKSDYGIMLFADQRYERADKRRKMPQWVSQQMHSSRFSMSTDMCVGVAREFLKQMAQPHPLEDQLGRSLWSNEHLPPEAQSTAAQQRLLQQQQETDTAAS